MSTRSRRPLARRPAALATAVLTACVIAPLPAVQSPPNPKGYVAYRAQSSLAIDGRLEDSAWKNAPWSDLFVDIEADARPRPVHATRMKMLWDDSNLYIAAELVEPHLWGTLTQHDSVIFRDNDFEVFIDPNGDNHEYYEVEINALNTTWDLFLPKPYKDDGKALDDWELAGMKTAVHLDGTLNDARDTDRGWTVELALPWKSIGQQARRPAPPRDGDQWRINFSRVQWPLENDGRSYRKPQGVKEANWVWSPQGVVDMHRPERWGYVQFSARTSGPVAYVANRDQLTLDRLHALYYAQRDYRKAHGRWAASLEELSATGVRETSPTVRMDVAGEQFEISMVAPPSGQLNIDPPVRLYIRQDSLVWKK